MIFSEPGRAWALGKGEGGVPMPHPGVEEQETW